MPIVPIIVLWLSAAFAPAPVQAQPPAEALAFESPWIREAPPASPVMAGYVRIENGTKREVLVEAVESPQFGRAEVHEMREVDGVMRMRPMRQLRVEPGQTLELAPGGLHLMLFSPKAPLTAGATATIDFVFGDGTRRSVEFAVRAPTE